jgi:hypothetical protein
VCESRVCVSATITREGREREDHAVHKKKKSVCESRVCVSGRITRGSHSSVCVSERAMKKNGDALPPHKYQTPAPPTHHEPSNNNAHT